MSTLPGFAIDWSSLLDHIRPLLATRHEAIRAHHEIGLLDGKIIDEFQLSNIWDGTGRKDWIKRIKENPDVEDCIDSARERLTEKYDATWLTKYHTLYYSVKNEGFLNDKGPPITTIKFGDDFYYRMDGTHRSSVLFDLGYETMQAMVFDFNNVRQVEPEINTLYEEWVLANYRNYQKTDGSGDSRIKDRYTNLVDRTRKYFSGKNVGDVGCNAGYLSILLANDEATSVKGFDIHELDLAAAEIFASRMCDNPSAISFHKGHVSENLDSLLSCEAIYFVRSIYHLGNDADALINKLNSGTTVIIECNEGHKKNLENPDEIVPRPGKRLALMINVVPFLEERGFEIDEIFENVDNVIVATKK